MSRLAGTTMHSGLQVALRLALICAGRIIYGVSLVSSFPYPTKLLTASRCDLYRLIQTSRPADATMHSGLYVALRLALVCAGRIIYGVSLVSLLQKRVQY